MKDDGGPAFPQDLQGRRGDDPQYQGMSLRDWFAGQALPGVIREMGRVQGIGSETFPQNVAAHCQRIADAMLAERAKGEA